MKDFYTYIKTGRHLIISGWVCILFLCSVQAKAQICPANVTTNLTAFPNTYYPGQGTLNVGDKSITLGAVPAGYGITPISTNDILLVIQMQGSQISSANGGPYGTGAGASGSGYLHNGVLFAGNMEYVVASNNVPLAGGLLTIKSGLVNKYKSAGYGTDGQYTYQVIRVPSYFNLVLMNTITAPVWNGNEGGVLILYASNNINWNSQTLSASGAGFRGGGGYQLGGGGVGLSTDFVTAAADNTNGCKGEGLAGTPRFVYSNTGTWSDLSTEGYPGGCFARGAPGNAGGGGTDGAPPSNTQNTGGGGGANGGIGGGGGNGWSSASPTGGKGGAIFFENSPSRMVQGGGGGAGTSNDGTGTPGSGEASSGACGGGIVIVLSNNTISGTGTIDVSGSAANSTVGKDGSGGGGAGGTAYIFVNSGVGLLNIKVNANGGTGGSNTGAPGTGTPWHGPGGGGGGGLIYANSILNVASSATGGNPGTTTGGVNYGATGGANGTIKQNVTAVQSLSFPSVCTLLSVQFLSIAADQQNGATTVKWEVAEEISTNTYIVERSEDGSNFAAIGSVPYKISASNVNQYDYTDDNSISATGILFYRVKQADPSGNYLYSRTIAVRVTGLSGKLSVFPNPAAESTTVSFASTTPRPITLKIFDLRGARIWEQQYQANTGVNTLQLDIVRTLTNGLYLLQWSDGQKPETVKLMVKH